MTCDNLNKLKNILATVFKVEPEIITESTSPDSLPSWDSLNHLKLILAIESEFNVQLTEEQSIEILSFPLIKEILKEHNIGF
jgi:acyl carrier protein